MKPNKHSRCSICRHPDRHAVEMAHVAGCSLEAIAQKFGTDAHPLHRASVHRHVTRHIDDTFRASLLAGVPLAELSARAADEIELAIRAGAVRGLRTRADKQRKSAAEGTSPTGDRFPNIIVRSPSAAMAVNLAAAFERIADEIESEAMR